MTDFERGFMAKCAEHGADGRALLEKRALLEGLILRSTPEGRAAFDTDLDMAINGRTSWDVINGNGYNPVWHTGPRTAEEKTRLMVDGGGTYWRRKAIHDALAAASRMTPHERQARRMAPRTGSAAAKG